MRPAIAAAWARLRPTIAAGATRVRAVAGRTWARLDGRARAGVLGGAGLLVVVAVTLATLGRGGGLVPTPSAPPSAGPAATLNPAQAEALLADVLPTPSTIDSVLLVENAGGLDATGQGWLNDMRKQLGNVEPLAYRDATLERLRQYFVVFVIDRSADLDPRTLAAAYAAGVTVHLIGPAASYQAQVAAGTR